MVKTIPFTPMHKISLVGWIIFGVFLIISNHAAVTVCSMSPPKKKQIHRIWKMNINYLKDVEFVKYVIKHIKEFVTLNVTSSLDKPPVHIIWDSFKACIRGVIIASSSGRKKELDKIIKKIRESHNFSGEHWLEKGYGTSAGIKIGI